MASVIRFAIMILGIIAFNSARVAVGGELEIRVVDQATGEPLPVRMRVYDARGRKPKPKGMPFYEGQFSTNGPFILRLGNGRFLYELQAGPEYQHMVGSFDMSSKATDNRTLQLKRIVDMKSHGWWSGDLWVERPTGDLATLMMAEDLHLLAGPANKEASVGKEPLPNLVSDRISDLSGVARSKGGRRHAYRLGDDVHINVAQPSAWDLPLWLAEGNIDSFAVLRPDLRKANTTAGLPLDESRFPEPDGAGRFREYIYYEILNAGFKMAPAAFSGSGISREHPGTHRVYVHFDGEFSRDKWWESLSQGRSMISSGPLMLPKVNGKYPGHTFVAYEGDTVKLSTALTLHTREKIEYLQFIKNGRSVAEVRLDESAKRGRKLPEIEFTESGWMLVRAVIEGAEDYRYASTAPYYVEFDKSPRVSQSACKFFTKWLMAKAKAVKNGDSPDKEQMMKRYRRARDFWRERMEQANAE